MGKLPLTDSVKQATEVLKFREHFLSEHSCVFFMLTKLLHSPIGVQHGSYEVDLVMKLQNLISPVLWHGQQMGSFAKP